MLITEEIGSQQSLGIEGYKSGWSDTHDDCSNIILDRFFKGRGRKISKKPTMAMFVCPNQIEGHPGNFNDLIEQPEEIEQTFQGIGINCNVFTDGTIESLVKVVTSGADIIMIVSHGGRWDGIYCNNDTLTWTAFEELLIPCGLLIMLPCYSADAGCEDEDGIFNLTDVILEKVDAALITYGSAHHMCYRYNESNAHFEIHRYARFVDQCLKIGFKKAVLKMRNELNKNLGICAPHIIEHEMAIGCAKWGLQYSEGALA
jgi:hypothetical protein